jgi:hypothetical protein
MKELQESIRGRVLRLCTGFAGTIDPQQAAAN